MNYLKVFTEFFAKNIKLETNKFNSLLIKDLEENKSSFQESDMIFDIEPVKVNELKNEKGEYDLYHYDGTFIYGFQKDGIFHEVPDDLSTKIERRQNESGRITFYVNKYTGMVDKVSETFAGNSWGALAPMINSEKKKKGFSVWKRIGIILVAIIIITNIYEGIKPIVSSFLLERSLKSYDSEISECVLSKKSINNKADVVVIGLEYECAVDIASTLYKEDSNKAIALCMKYSPFSNLGRDLLGSDMESTKSLNNTACKSSLENYSK